MNIILNGKSYTTESQGIFELLEELNIPSSIALVELNGVALLRSEMKQARVTEGDQIEILQVAAGG